MATKPDRTPLDYHDVMIALGKARAAATLLEICGSDSLTLPSGRCFDEREEKDTRDWIRCFAQDALDEALVEAEVAFRKSVTPEQAREQIAGGRA
jgi:hypothetical protein